MEQESAQPTMTQRFLLQILGAEPVDLPEGALSARVQVGLHGTGKDQPAYKIMFVAVLPESDAGALIARAQGHRIPVETIDAI